MVGAAATAVKNGVLRVLLNQNDVQCVVVHKKMTQNSNSLPQKSIEHTFVCEGDIDLFSRIQKVLLCVRAAFQRWWSSFLSPFVVVVVSRWPSSLHRKERDTFIKRSSGEKKGHFRRRDSKKCRKKHRRRPSDDDASRSSRRKDSYRFERRFW